jgi:hypothetical protein
MHSKSMKARIGERLSRYTFTVTGEVVKQEYKRRLLKEAKYLLETLAKYKSFSEMYHHVVRLPPAWNRKRNICLQVIGQLFDKADDRELAERLTLNLHYLLTLGMDEFESGVGQVIRYAGCACAKFPVQEKVRYKRYEFGPDKCSSPRVGTCGIVDFVQRRSPELRLILERLRALPAEEKSDEIQQAEAFLELVLQDPSSALAMDPCYRVGDLIIAMESVGIPTFYTLNGKESQHFCRVLDQNLIVRPSNPESEDIECLSTDQDWPKFARKRPSAE